MVWKGGPRSSLSYKLDMAKKSDEPWEKKLRSKKKRAVVKRHYSHTKRGRRYVVKAHMRRL